MDNKNCVRERIVFRIDFLSKQILLLEKKNRENSKGSGPLKEAGSEIDNFIEMKIGELAMLSELLNNETATSSD